MSTNYFADKTSHLHYHKHMVKRSIFALMTLVILAVSAFSYDGEYFFLAQEPLIRIGLSTNSASVSITTSDSSLVAFSPDEPSRMLATNKVTVSARAYRPPTFENFRFEIQNIATATEANDIARQVREDTGETALVSINSTESTWIVWIGRVKDTIEEADAFKATLLKKALKTS